MRVLGIVTNLKFESRTRTQIGRSLNKIFTVYPSNDLHLFQDNLQRDKPISANIKGKKTNLLNYCRDIKKSEMRLECLNVWLDYSALQSEIVPLCLVYISACIKTKFVTKYYSQG